MYSVSISKESSKPLIEIMERTCFCVDEDVLNHALIKELIGGTLDEELFRLFLEQQTWLGYEISQQLIAISRLNHTTYIKPLFLKIANYSLIEADDLSNQLGKFRISSYEVLPVCKEYINFLSILEDKFLFLTAILPRFWFKAQLRQKFIKLNLFKHPYKRYIKYCFYHDAREPIIRIINSLDTQFRTIPAEQKSAIKQVFSEASAHEWELLNQTYNLASI
ncbi:MAG: hypothetical protein J0H12_06935 [Candidatus Paracaedimonas acanthamoebae]|uniref:Thiaminase-2/PQQC domain-containing protein n=1 Tax=Candidatus Paracaedimonas acanthamoebae TaxID=244581 RepID=A0A8J7PS88_9PROT|nr:hypothetical protein [Candidatus Paracaedimonas acanthamoebae]